MSSSFASIGSHRSKALSAALLLGLTCTAHAQSSSRSTDRAIREARYQPDQVIDVAVARGVATLITLPSGEAIRYVAAGRASDCAKPEDAWCVSGPEGANLVFIKARAAASRSNNLEVVTAARAYSFRLNVVGDDLHGATQRLVVSLDTPSASSRLFAPTSAAAEGVKPRTAAPSSPPRVVAHREVRVAPSDPQLLLTERLAQAPRMLNSDYSVAIGERSDDIVPIAVFDDGRFTYLRLPGNREIPAVFHVTADNEETVVNTRMEDDLLVVDRVSRRLRLRVGNQVVAVINEAFDLDGLPPVAGMTIDGVERLVKAPLHGANR